jgi:ribonuclease-3
VTAPERQALVDALGVELDPALLERALTHRSYAYENGGLPTNERLEFLGDSVLGLIVTDALYRDNPEVSEGQLAKLRAAVVNMRALAGVSRSLNLGAHLRLGRGEETTGGRDKTSILADGLEALIGAVYLSGGLDGASSFVHGLFDPLLMDSALLGAGLDWKTSLQELSAAESLRAPEYLVTESGPDHAKNFVAVAVVAGEQLGLGSGTSKKLAEQEAAAQAWLLLRERAAGAAGTSGAPPTTGCSSVQRPSAASTTS